MRLHTSGPKAVLWATGFRPFFLLAAAMAMLWVPLWILVLRGIVPLQNHLGSIGWHSHEMVFGYATAVVAGFLLTATPVWTENPTASGGWLMLLVMFWVAGRTVMCLPPGTVPSIVVIAVDATFLPALAIPCMRPVIVSRSWRNILFGPLLLLMAAANLMVHLASKGIAPGYAPYALNTAIDALLLMLAIVGGRVVPLFTRNALPHCRVRERKEIGPLALWSIGTLTAVDLCMLGDEIVAAAAMLAGIANLARMSGWSSTKTLRNPILAVLHVGYAWLGVGLLLRGIARIVPVVPKNAGIHSLTVGALGVLTLGMMSRVALGHTGRKLQVHPMMAVGYVLLVLSALVRVAGTFVPAHYTLSLVVGSALWAVPFAIFIAIYGPILLRPRADGKPG